MRAFSILPPVEFILRAIAVQPLIYELKPDVANACFRPSYVKLTVTGSGKLPVTNPSTSEKFDQCQSTLLPAVPLQRRHVKMRGRPPTLSGGTCSTVNISIEREILKQIGQQ